MLKKTVSVLFLLFLAMVLCSASLLAKTTSKVAKKSAATGSVKVSENGIRPKVKPADKAISTDVPADAISNADDLFSVYMKNADGLFSQFFQGKKEEQKKLGSDDVVFEAFVKAIGIQESGGDYGDINSRTGASGKYQIMPGNWPYWAEAAGLSRTSRMTAENQEIVARYKLWEYYSKYGVQGASVAWYAGEANAVRWVDEKPYAIGENGKYSWYARQGRGDEPSVYQYVCEVVNKTNSILAR